MSPAALPRAAIRTPLPLQHHRQYVGYGRDHAGDDVERGEWNSKRLLGARWRLRQRQPIHRHLHLRLQRRNVDTKCQLDDSAAGPRKWRRRRGNQPLIPSVAVTMPPSTGQMTTRDIRHLSVRQGFSPLSRV